MNEDLKCEVQNSFGGLKNWHVHVQEISGEYYFGFDFCTCLLYHFSDQILAYGIEEKPRNLFIFSIT